MPSTPSTATESPPLKAQFLLLMGRLPKHWRGELPLWEALTHGVAIVILPAVIAITVAFAIELVSFESRAVGLVFYAGFGLSLLAASWWCKGMFALSSQLQSQQRILAALVAFLLPCPVAWNLVSTWGIHFWDSTNELVVQPYMQQTVQRDPWMDRPASVVGIPENHRLSLTGGIGWGSAKALASALDAHPELHLIELESPGGISLEAAAMVDLLQKRGMDTLVRGRCASACTKLFVAGKRRFVGPKASFVFHQSGFKGRKHDTVWSITEHESSILYRAQGVSNEFADAALNESYYGAWMPDVLDLKRSGFATQWWSDRPAEYN